MTSTPYGTPTRDAASSPAPRRATLAQDAVTVAIGLWLIGGLFSDGWAHHNVPELEGFFTPWQPAVAVSLRRSNTSGISAIWALKRKRRTT